MKHWDYNEARGLKAVGTSWEEIARIFGVSSYQARMRCDPVWAKQRRAQVQEAAKMMRSSLGKRDHVHHHVIPEPVKAEDTNAGPFMTPSGIMAYRKHVPNRISLTSSPINEGIATKAISLPFVSILRGEG